jgi:hypothetical protein
MTAVRGSGDGLITGMRWVARILGLLASGLFVFFLVCAGVGVCRMLSWGELRGMPLFIVLAVTAVGVLIGWRWERLGGGIATIGAIALIALVYFGSGRGVFTTALMVSLPFFVVGVLFLACSWRTRAVAI